MKSVKVTKRRLVKLTSCARTLGICTRGNATTHGSTTPIPVALDLVQPASIKLYLITIENTGMEETTATTGKRYTDDWRRTLSAGLSRHAGGIMLGAVKTCMRVLAQTEPSRSPLEHVPLTGPCKTSEKAAAPVMPTAKKTRMQMVVDTHKVLLTLTPGRFSFTQEGTVVTKPKLNRIVPRTAAFEPVWGSVFTTRSGVPSMSPIDVALAAIQTIQQPMVRTKATV
mmetsp:Transcript_25053/g.66243  ORF Transcript_25053/g.66243 Transcript_25053/m.66243 type:complete len:226 (-) Transcript_25053:274-951(-)